MKTTYHGEPGFGAASPSFRHFLQAELGRRCDRNPRYSLRAFANYLGLDHATLSQLLRGKRRLTERSIRRLGTRLGLEPEALDGYAAAEPVESALPALESKLAERARLGSDVVSLVTEWQHYAILELIRLPGFRPDVRWIARVLDLPADAVTLAVDRLVRLGLLVMERRDRWIDAAGDTVTSLSEYAHDAIRRGAHNPRPAGPRPASSSRTTIAVNRARLAGALQRIERFRQELSAFLEGEGAPDDVYSLEVHLLPLTTLNQNGGTADGSPGHAVADHHQES